MNSPPYVPYQAYKSKRHSRNLSNTQLVPNVSPPPVCRPPVSGLNGHARDSSVGSQKLVIDNEKSFPLNGANRIFGSSPPSPISDSVPHLEHLTPLSTNIITSPAASPTPSEEASSSASAPGSDKQSAPTSPTAANSPSPPSVSLPVSGISSNSSVARSPASPPPGSSPKLSGARRTSVFRHVPLRGTTPRPLPSSPLRPSGTHSRTLSNLTTSSRQIDPAQGRSTESSSRTSSTRSTPLLVPHERMSMPVVPSLDLPPQAPPSGSTTLTSSPVPDPRILSSQAPSPAPSAPPKDASTFANRAPAQPQDPQPPVSPAPIANSSSQSSRRTVRARAPYLPGFQPGGHYRPRTDEFIEARRRTRDSARVERTRLERRLEKLINLHFPNPNDTNRRNSLQIPDRNGHTNDKPGVPNRRASSIFDISFSDLKNKSAADLWKEVVQPQSQSGSKVDTRAAEQTIAPWQEDSTVSHCPLCSASFHTLTNRKHHCRLCGRIVCSLPVKYPQRPQTCSLLFVADPRTGQIEEVGEGVDYGVRRRNTGPSQGKGKGKGATMSDEDKFLKGVRICRDCRPVLLRRQYIQEVHRIPTFSKLYDVFVLLEKEIEDSLPQFQELVISLSNGHDDRPATEVAAARKRLVEAFAQYDALAKRIRLLPCPEGPNSSQDRVQIAILTRANLFLQKNMFPLQALPKPKRTSSKSPESEPNGSQVIDPDSEIAHALQPLLEQEALLESFVEEAKAHRKFEDAKTLKTNLAEIRAEIDRVLANADSGFGKSAVESAGPGVGSSKRT